MDIYIVSEDEVTRTVLKRILKEYAKKLNIIQEFPVRGGRIKKDILKYNELSKKYPVILLTDLDIYDCPIKLIKDFCKDFNKNVHLHIRVAVDEAEAWLMADRIGFSKYFNVQINSIPKSKVLNLRKPDIIEMEFPYKSSLYLMKDIIPTSKDKKLIDNLIPRYGAKKGPEYNSTLIPFIENIWNIEEAMNNSYSLRTTIKRLKLI
jgi:hypothetical protein